MRARTGEVRDRAYRPVRGDPFARGMGEHRGQIDDAGRLIDRGGLNGGDLVVTQRLAHDVEATGERGIPEGRVRPPLPVRSGLSRSTTFPGLTSSPCALARPRPAPRPIYWIAAWADLPLHDIEADGADFERLRPHAMPDRLLRVLGH